MPTQSFIVEANTKFSPFTGQPLNVPVGTVIYGDQSLGKDYGTSPNSPSNNAFDVPSTNNFYGQTKDSSLEQPAFMEEQGIQTAGGQSSILDPQFLLKLSSDPSLVAFYTHALAYGGYTMGDVLNDMKRRELASQGNVQASNLKIIDPEMTRSTYLGTAEGQNSVTATASVIPTFNLQGIMDPSILKYGSNIPDQLFTQLVPTLDKNSQEFKDAVSGVKSAFYDLANAQLQATTEQDKAVADFNYNQFKGQIEKQYGVILSNDATQAWKQIDNLENTFADRNLGGSGLQNEAIDQTLRSVRKYDQYARESKLTQEDAQMAATYKASATPQQIQALDDQDKAKGLPPSQYRTALWGLKPSPDILATYDMANLKAQYPNETDAQLQAYRNSILDENGNYRSTIYSNYYSNIAANNASKNATAETTVLTDALNKENAAYSNYDQSQPYSKSTVAGDTQVKNDAANAPNSPNQGPATPPAPATPPITSLNPASSAAANISSKLSNPPASVPPASPTGVPKSTSSPTPAPVKTPKTTNPVYPTPTGQPIAPTPKTSTSGGSYNPNQGAINLGSNTPSSPYTIKSGDTLGAIAARNNTTVDNLAKINNISDPNKIQAGQTLKFQ